MALIGTAMARCWSSAGHCHSYEKIVVVLVDAGAGASCWMRDRLWFADTASKGLSAASSLMKATTTSTTINSSTGGGSYLLPTSGDWEGITEP